MTQAFELEQDESVIWEARPAPRCYTFRHWRHSLFGLVFLLLCFGWQVLGVEVADSYQLTWLAWLPLPFVLVGLYFSVGHLIQARLEWNNVVYAVTQRRIIVRRGLVPRQEALALSEMTYFRLHHHGDQLGTLRIFQGQEQRLVLHCIESPRRLTALLEEVFMTRQGAPGAAPDNAR